MKRCILLGLILIAICAKVSGQNFVLSATPQLYIIKGDDKTLTTDSNGVSMKETDANSNFLIYVNPTWIDSMKVINGQDAKDKYGPAGLNGVIIVTLKKDGFTKMRPQDKEKFKTGVR